MRKGFSIVGAALLAATTFAVPAEAQTASISGSCGARAGTYGDNNITSEESNDQGDTVTAIFYRVQYSGLPVGSTMGVIIRLNDELESQSAVASTTINNANGQYDGRLGAASLIDPANQGGGITFTSKQSLATNKSRSERTSARRAGSFTSPQIGGGIGDADYHFYVYLGEIRDAPATVKDGPEGPRFFADETRYLGKFSCGATDEE